MLLGLIASQHGGEIEWDAAKLRITNRPELSVYLKEPVRKGLMLGFSLYSILQA